MDVFKLLSKSSKAPQIAPAQKLPSSGAAANPQLFGHDETERPKRGQNKSRKRKRGQDAVETAEDISADIDFFGGEARGTRSGRKDGAEIDSIVGRKQAQPHEKEQVLFERGEEPLDDDSEVYDEDECKRILRSHKLKIVVLEDFGAQEAVSGKREKKSKKKKERKKGKAEKAKKEKKQLFPPPLTSFAQLRTRFGISRRLATNIEEQGYKMPTEVQIGALPLLLRKHRSEVGSQGADAKREADALGLDFQGDVDLLTIAPTGSGKTIAFLIPILDALLSQAKISPATSIGPRAVIVAPTKELASQIVNEARKLAKGTGIKATLMKKGMEVVERSQSEGVEDESDASEASDDGEDDPSGSDGGEKPTESKRRKRRRAEIVKAAILVATPLALLNTLKCGDQTSDLPSVRYLVLDEADVLLDPLFREQTLSIWSACSNPHLRVGLWSATMGSNIESLAVQTLNERWNSLSPTSPLPSRPPLIRLVVGLKDTAIPNITHKLIYAATEQGKLLGLRQLLHPTAISSTDTSPSLRPPFLVFTQTIPRAIALHSELLYDIPPEAGGSTRIAVLHSNLSSSARDAVMRRFRLGEVWILITTDLLARGVDFRGLNGVVNYDVPTSAAAYVHRVGRTGRAGREGGVAVTFYTKEDVPHVKNVANVIRASERLRGVGEGEGSVKQWLLDALPTPSKREKQVLKKRGVEARRAGAVGGKDGKGRARISTKSGYERRKENNIKGARLAGQRRERQGDMEVDTDADGEGGSASEFEGFGE